MGTTASPRRLIQFLGKDYCRKPRATDCPMRAICPGFTARAAQIPDR